MQVQLKAWGNSTGIRLSKEVLNEAGFSENDVLNVEVTGGRIVLTGARKHLSLRERAERYGGNLNLGGELPREEAEGTEVW